MPPQLRQQAERFILARGSKKYIFMVVGLDTDGSRKILEALSVTSHRGYSPFIGQLPLVLNHATHTALGLMAPRYGLWSVQQLPARFRGMVTPPKLWAEYQPQTSYSTAKKALAAAITREKRTPPNEQRIFRLRHHGTASGNVAVRSYHFTPYGEDYLQYIPCF
jgi:hypothetical protein